METGGWHRLGREAGEQGEGDSSGSETVLLIRVKDTGSTTQCQQLPGFIHEERGHGGLPAC